MLLYLIKTILLVANKTEALQKMTKATKVPEMIISFLFLLTGIYMVTQVPEIKPLLIIKIVVVLASIPVAVIGFKKQKKALAILSLLMIIAAYGMAEMSKKSSTSVPVTETASGKDIYESKCGSCHGSDGKQGAMGATDLSLSQLDNTTIMTVIAEGKGAMAPFNGTLTDVQIKMVADYVETLKK